MLIKGPFSIKWGDNVIDDVEEISVDHEIASDEFETIQGKNYEIDGAYKVSAVITLLASDIPALAAILPQHFVANGEVLSTGETVSSANGAIDIVPGACDESTVYNDLDIMSCANPSNVFRIVNARTKIDGVEVDGKIQKVMVKFVGESDTDEATIQFFTYGTIAVVS
jgi:hypothetical protein